MPNKIFSEYEYQRSNAEKIESDFNQLISNFESCIDFEMALKCIDDINVIRNDFLSQYNICYIRHTINTKDAFYEAENSFFDNYSPIFSNFISKYYKALIHHQFRSELEAHFGKQLFRIAELSIKTFDPAIIEDLQEENQLSSEYTKLKATAELIVDENKYNLSSIIPLNVDKDRSLRKKSNEIKWAFYEQNEAKIDEIYDKLVKVRHRIALKLGYQNFVQLGYDRMLRSDYNAEMVAIYRDQIAKYIVPLNSKIYAVQQERTQLDTLYYYDEDFHFTDGNPTPKGDPDYILAAANKMYSELSPETAEFFAFMQENQLMDLVARDGKATGGYCTYINNYKAPFIFSNFNGTSGDVDVLTHEAGHAFQVFRSRNHSIPEYNWPTYEACEIHSMSMEFFTWPWMNQFFGEDTHKYYCAHLTNALLFLPYGAAVDEFQHEIYSNIDLSPKERKLIWKQLEKKYLPHRNNDQNQYLENGGFWQKQNHIFNSPFYYIDYTLAQFCALTYWDWSRTDQKAAWNSYVSLCNLGGKFAFTELIQKSGLKSPFEKDSFKGILNPIINWLFEHKLIKESNFQ
ncbi:MAG: M3 family oligoendopeptidase [Saprospiraceae bacterium]|nr:M3 family oligoendopeptidase [Saprospiraceae bacterium]